MSGDYVERLRAWRRQLNADHCAWYERNGHPVPEPLHPADEEVPCRLGCGTDLTGPNGEYLPLLADLDATLAELERLRKDVAKLGEHVAPVDDREPMNVNWAAEALYAYAEQRSTQSQFGNQLRAVLDSRQSWRYRAFKLEDDVEQLRSERDEFRRQRNEWVSDMHAAFAAGLETPRPATDEQSWRLSQGWIADRVAERQAVRDGGNTP